MAMIAINRAPDSRRLRRVVLGCAIALMLPGGATAQNAPPAIDKSQALDQLKTHDKDLEAAREQQRQSAEAEAALKREIDELSAGKLAI